MPVEEKGGIHVKDSNVDLWFCSEFCRQQFLRHPHAYVVARPRPSPRISWPDLRVAYFSMEVVLTNEIPILAVWSSDLCPRLCPNACLAQTNTVTDGDTPRDIFPEPSC